MHDTYIRWCLKTFNTITIIHLTFFRIIFKAKTRYFSRVSKGMGRGDQARRHELQNLATFYHTRIFFYCFPN